MAFPVSPTNGQTATVNNIVYTFSTANNTWTRSATGFVNLGASGNISAAGNIYGNFIIGNVSGNVIANTAVTVTGNAQPNITSVGTLTSLTSSGLISTTGNIAGSYLFGNGSQLTNAVANTINTTFNGSANTFYVDFVANNGGASQAIWNSPFLTFVPISGILGASAFTATGNINGANILSGGLLTATGNILGGNILTAGLMSSTGNAIHGNILTAGLISATSTITSAANITGGNILTGGLISSTGTITGSSHLGTVASLSGNVIGGNIVTGGLVSATGTVTGSSLLGTVVSASGNITGGNLITSGIATVANNLIITSPTPQAEGGQLVLAWANISGITGQANSTWNMDVDSSTVLRMFYQNAAGAASVLLQASPTSNIVTFPNSAGVSSTGNVSAPYFIGNGSALTGIVASAGASITNGTSNVVVAASGNVTVGVAGTAAVTTFTTTGLTANSVAATSNGAGTNFKVGDDAWIGDLNIADSMSIRGQQNAANGYIVFGNADGSQLGRAGSGPLTYAGAFSASGNVTGGNILTVGLMSSTGNAIHGNILTAGLISATGNVTGNFILGNGSQLTGIITSVSNVVNGGSNLNIAAANANVTISVSTVGNVAVFSPTGVSVLGTIAGNGNITGSNLLTAGLISATGTITSAANVVGGNITTAGLVSATANVTGGNLLTAGIMSSTGNAIHGNILTAGLISATGTAVTGVNTAQFGVPNVTLHATAVVTSAGNSNQSSQFAFQNFSALSNASADIAVYNNLGTDSSYFIDMGIVSSTYNGTAAGANVFNPNDGYLYVAGNSITGPVGSGANIGNLILGATNGQIITWLGNTSTANIVTVTSNTGFAVTGVVSASGNVIGGNIRTAGIVSATGNITGNYFIGNGSQLTGISAGGGGANISNGTSNVNIATSGGNVTVGVAGTANVATFTSSGMSAPVVAATNGILVNSSNVTANYTIAAGTNGFSVGPITTDNNVSVTVTAGQRWVII